jgi:hypothetical protein
MICKDSNAVSFPCVSSDQPSFFCVGGRRRERCRDGNGTVVELKASLSEACLLQPSQALLPGLLVGLVFPLRGAWARPASQVPACA